MTHSHTFVASNKYYRVIYVSENDDEGIEEELVDEPNEMIQKEEKNADGVCYFIPFILNNYKFCNLLIICS